MDTSFYEQALGESKSAFTWGQDVYEQQMAALKKSQRSMDYYQSTLGTEAQLNAPYSTSYSLGKTPGKKYFRDLGMEKDAYKSKAQRESLYQEQWGGAVSQANDLMAQAMAASRAGDTARADELKSQADALFTGAPMAEFKEKKGAGEGLGKFKGKGIQADSPIGSQLASPAGQIVGGLVHRGEQLLDPESEESQRLISSLTDPALAQLDAAETKAGRALATGERTAQRQMRDLGLAGGAMRAPGAEAAIGARASEEFAGKRADVATTMGAARAQVVGEARAYYETMAPQFAANAVEAADRWVNDRAFINKTYLQLTTSMAQSAMQLSGQVTSSMAGLTGAAYGAGLQHEAQQAALDESSKTDWVSVAVGAVAMIAGAFTGGIGTVLGGALMAGKGFLGGGDGGAGAKSTSGGLSY
jgi:hypothetical protein